MKITYHGHSCFSVTQDNFTIVLDPYRDVAGFGTVKLEANMVICSHDHFDHAYTDGVQIKAVDGSRESIQNMGKNPFTISTIECFHDDVKGLKRGKNKITVLEAEGKRVAHLGDLGHKLSEKEIAKLRGIDVLMIPVGGFYTIDAKTAVDVIKEIEPKAVIPMHYRDGKLDFDNIGDINVFLELVDDSTKEKLMLVRGYEKSIEI